MADWGTFTINRGDTSYLDFGVANQGVAVDLNGWTLFFTAKHRAADADAAAVISKRSTTGGITVTNAMAGTGYVTLLPADTAGLEARTITLWADLQGKDAGGNIYTLAHGKIAVRADISLSTT